MDANTTDKLNAQGMESLDEAGSPPAQAGVGAAQRAMDVAVIMLESAAWRDDCEADRLEGAAKNFPYNMETLLALAKSSRLSAEAYRAHAKALSSFSRPSPEPTEGQTRLPRGARSPSVPLVELQRELTRRISEARVAKDVATHCDNSASWSAATGKESVLMELHEWVTRTYSQAEPAESDKISDECPPLTQPTEKS